MQQTKICSQCGKELPLDMFPFRNKSKGTYRANCKECHNKEMKIRYQHKQEVIRDVKEFCGCAKCGVTKHYLLDFHHLDPLEKENTISRLMAGSYSITTVLQELKKCVCLCSNCHREFHWLQANEGLTIESYLQDSKYFKISVQNLKQKIEYLTLNPSQQGFAQQKTIEVEKHYFCARCGKEISKGGVLCVECRIIEQRKVINRPTREELKEMIRKEPFTTIGAKYKVTDNSIRKWCKSYDLPFRKKDIKLYSDEEWELL